MALALTVLIPLARVNCAKAVVNNDTMISNLDTWLSQNYSGKKAGMLTAARLFLDHNFEPAFVAGILANIASEGAVGIFEGSSRDYVANKPQFAWVENNYSYISNYSYQYIYNKNLSTVEAMMQGCYNATGMTPGLGMAQWSHDRCINLIAKYKKYAGSSTTITYNQCLQAESEMMLDELSGGWSYVYTDWRNDYASSSDAAYWAGYKVCSRYECPSATSAYNTRGNLARSIYEVMMEPGNTYTLSLGNNSVYIGAGQTAHCLFTLPSNDKYAFYSVGDLDTKAVIHWPGSSSILT